MGKFFNVTVKPTIPAAIQHAGTFGDGTILFDWTEFNIPKGAARLLGCTALVRGLDGVDQDGASRDFSVIFAKSINNIAPTTLGAQREVVDTGGWFNNVIAQDYFDSSHGTQDGAMVYMSMYKSNRIASEVSTETLQGEPDSGINVGYDKIYVAGLSQSTIGFSTAIVTSQIVDVSGLSAAQLVNADIQGTDPRQVFAPGDIIHAEDGVILGEVLSIPDANTINFKTDGSVVNHGNGEVLFTNPNGLTNWKIQNGAGAAGDLASGDELYNINPITLILHFEK